jgi:hypothetical protein
MSDVSTTKRRAMSPQRRLRIFEAAAGVCILCNVKIDGVKEKWIVEHLRPLGLGGADEDGNCGPAHETCRREKDKADVASIAKAKRSKARHVGAKRPASALSRPKEQRAPMSKTLPPKAIYITKDARS